MVTIRALTTAAILFACCQSVAAQSATHPCLIEPKLKVKLGSAVPGILEKVHFNRGDWINQEELVAELRSGVEAANMDIARVRAESDLELRMTRVQAAYDQRRLQRQVDLSHRGIVSDQEFERVKTEAERRELEIEIAMQSHALAKLELERAIEALEMRRIRSPITGVVMERHLSRGEYVTQEGFVYTVAQLDPLHVETFLPVEFIGKLAMGTRGVVVPEGSGGRKFEATIVVIDAVADAASGTVGVRLELPNPEHKILAGIKCEISFDTTAGRSRNN